MKVLISYWGGTSCTKDNFVHGTLSGALNNYLLAISDNETCIMDKGFLRGALGW